MIHNIDCKNFKPQITEFSFCSGEHPHVKAIRLKCPNCGKQEVSMKPLKLALKDWKHAI